MDQISRCLAAGDDEAVHRNNIVWDIMVDGESTLLC